MSVTYLITTGHAQRKYRLGVISSRYFRIAAVEASLGFFSLLVAEVSQSQLGQIAEGVCDLGVLDQV